MKLYIDADILRYQLGAIGVRNVYNKKNPKAMMPAPVEMVEAHVEKIIQRAIKETHADEYVCVLSGTGNFRFDIATIQTYKGNRSGATRPYHYNTVGDYIIANHPCIVVNGMEADDYIGIQQRADLDNSVTASRDKDLTTFPGWHFRFACGETQPEVPLHWITRFDAWKFFFKQMLIGDSTDNIIGCGVKKWVKWGSKEMWRRKGVGSKGADEMLSECRTVAQMYMIVCEAYQEHIGNSWKESMIENARLLYIGQEKDKLFDWSWVDYEVYQGIFEESDETTSPLR